MVKHKFLPLFFVSLIFISGLSACVSAQVEIKKSADVWNPQRTWVFSVALLKWKDSENFESFPQKDRRDKILLDTWRQRGVPENQIVYLKDEQATTANIRRNFESLLKQTKPGDWIIVYYEGHGYRDDNDEQTFLASYDAGVKETKGWAVNSIPQTIDKFFKGSNAVIALDNCYSGAMAEAVKNRQSKISYAVLASANSDLVSTGNWTFTESLIYAFRGESFIDDDADGKVTIGELMQNAEDDMVFAEEQLTEFALTGNFSAQTIISAAKKRTSPRVGERIDAYDGDDWYKAIITDAFNGKFKVHYFGYDYDEDQIVPAKWLRASISKRIKVGTKIDALSEGKWFPARVLEIKKGSYYIAFDDYGREYNEWIPAKKVRLRS